MIYPPTERQMKYIRAIEEVLGYAHFDGSTLEDAREWISEYKDDYKAALRRRMYDWFD